MKRLSFKYFFGKGCNMKKYMVMFTFLLVPMSVITFSKAYANEGDNSLKLKIEEMERQLMELKEQLNKQAETSKAEKKELQALRVEVRCLVPGE